MLSSLALGTVQFGLPYGIANEKGQIGLEEASEILNEARKNGIKTIDTAVVYGDSEKRLGQIGVANWDIVSKLPPVPKSASNIQKWAVETVTNSISRLRVSKLSGLLLHQPETLLEREGEKLYEALNYLKLQKIVNKIGISIYDPNKIDSYLSKYDLDIIQLPMNVLDKRLLNLNRLSELKKRKIEIHVRSIFLQGLLLMESKRRPTYFNQWNPLLEVWDLWLKENQISALEACLGFVGSITEIDRIVIGVDSKEHLTEVLSACRSNRFLSIPENIYSNDENLILPFNWKI
ncbi:oxidoreductase, aldo/keto reductase family protein [Leptospira interrogans str. 2003000735]|uniref:Oxidoreductase, aldo/keto reductase family protein n=2 Tax=Leptospira interrogans TaxID=173 RepID=A0A829DEI6_LEPIR|nr:aldo/keto reductase [Leptospira interrogans]EMY07131.1 oxidoreductase, aldo/keto reductase family protein [Leptospira interrogans str. 2002000626]AKH77633.1 aldo/keto reductase [Leptospira interrogans serovar Bratislava]EKN90456.1 oxidoreductase, aldo/keto reductase family protein [Leptospira interrogans str. 2002000624]EKQ36017.1 oxidoreductase, aldo/keto reductase family protein [Leptospira interrogans str. 2002000621]EKQ50000.1 oxidoreductase, aldo/keto reductase family protein [Leptospi